MYNVGRRFCFIDMLFVALRNTKDFSDANELMEINDILRNIDAKIQTPINFLAVPHRILFAEIFIRFRKDYTPKTETVHDTDWSVSFYKILSFDVLNFDPNKWFSFLDNDCKHSGCSRNLRINFHLNKMKFIKQNQKWPQKKI